MADNIKVREDPVGPAVKTDDVDGEHFQVVKVDVGADGASSPLLRGQQTKANSLPVALASDTDVLPVSTAALPLPSGASTSAKQDTGNTSLTAIQTVEGTTADAAVDTDTTGTVSGKLRGLVKLIVNLLSRWPAALGAGGGLKVDGSGTALPVSAATLPLPSGAATAANQSAEQTLVGAVTEAAPATDTASSGVNGRLQRIAQRLSSIIGLLPTSLGQKAMSASLPVVLPSDQEVTVNVSGFSGINDTDNDFDSTVANSASVNGTFRNVIDYGSLTLIVSLDADTDGQNFAVDWSSNGSSTDLGSLVFVVADTGDNQLRAAVKVPILAPFYRVSYLNESGATRTVKIVPLLHPSVSELAFDQDRLSLHPVSDGSALRVPVALDSLPVGTNNIGDVDVLTLPSLPAGTNEIGRVGAKHFSGVIKDNSGDDCTVKVAHLDMTTATTTDIVAAVASKKIRVLQFGHSVNENISTDVNFARGAGTTRVTGSKIVRMAGVAGDGGKWTEVAFPGAFLFETVAGEALRVTQSAAADLSTSVVYIEVD